MKNKKSKEGKEKIIIVTLLVCGLVVFLFKEVLECFTNEVEDRLCYFIENIVNDFKKFLLENHMANLRISNEYSLELFTLGVIWKYYINRATELWKEDCIYIVVEKE